MEIHSKEQGSLQRITPTAPTIEETTPSRSLYYGLPTLRQEDIEEALTKYLSKRLAYKKKFVKQMHLTDVLTEGIYIYRLETFGEIRTKSSAARPYGGYSIDSDRNGSPPSIWDIPVYPHRLFQDSEMTMDIPHTEFVRLCNECQGKGYIKCSRCEGTGSVFCEMCRNKGTRTWDVDRCIFCRRWGNEGFVACCETCNGNRQLKCTLCQGYGHMINCETLTVIWLNKLSEVAHKECKVPFMKISQVKGNTVFYDEKESLQPLMYPYVPIITTKSECLLKKHQGAFPNILKQRHSLHVVPVTTVRYSWKGKTGEFYIYGLEKKVYFKCFPTKWTSCTVI